MAPQGQILSNLGPVFCKKSTLIWIRKMSLFFGLVFPFFGCQNWPFLRGLTKCQNGGANVRMGVQRGIWFTFLIAALYWMIRVSKFNRDIFKLIAACSPSPLARSGVDRFPASLPEASGLVKLTRSGAAGRLIFDTPVAGDDQLMMILTNFE